MHTINLSANQTLLITNHGDEILYVDNVPVAGYKFGLGHFKNRQTNDGADYLEGIDDVLLMMPEEIESMWRNSDE